MTKKTKIGALAAIKKYFFDGTGVQLKEVAEEVKRLSPEDKSELGRLCAEALGCEFDG